MSSIPSSNVDQSKSSGLSTTNFFDLDLDCIFPSDADFFVSVVFFAAVASVSYTHLTLPTLLRV